MNLEKAIAEIEWLERLYLLLDTRPLQLSDRCAANLRHDEMNANNPVLRKAQHGVLAGSLRRFLLLLRPFALPNE
jgi:hypothetical protein